MVDQVERFLEKKYHDNPNLRQKLSALYQRYAAWGIKDRKFDKDFCDGRNDHFYPYLWEMLLAQHLKALNLEISSKDVGPDFKIDHKGQCVWIEAICPTPKDISKATNETILNHCFLALEEKNKKLIGRILKNGLAKAGYLENKIVQHNEPYMIALNVCRLNHKNKPLDIKAQALKIAFGDKGFFLNSDYAGVSAILCTSQGVDVLLGDTASIILIHNPFARNQIPPNIWGVNQEYKVLL